MNSYIPAYVTKVIHHLLRQSGQSEYFSADPEIVAPPMPGRSPKVNAVNPPVRTVMPNPPAIMAFPIPF